jgi:hypothetical protein
MQRLKTTTIRRYCYWIGEVVVEEMLLMKTPKRGGEKIDSAVRVGLAVSAIRP